MEQRVAVLREVLVIPGAISPNHQALHAEKADGALLHPEDPQLIQVAQEIQVKAMDVPQVGGVIQKTLPADVDKSTVKQSVLSLCRADFFILQTYPSL